MLSDLTIEKFLERVESSDPVPGGGSVAALSAALSASLSGMVVRLTLAKTADEGLRERMSVFVETASRLKRKLIDEIQRDADSYDAVIRAYRMPKGTEHEKATRSEAIQKSLVRAAEVPLSVAEAGVTLLSLAEIMVREGNANAVTDEAVAALMARSAVLAALYNVRINISSLKDEALRAEMAEKADALENKAVEMEGDILAAVRVRMEQGA